MQAGFDPVGYAPRGLMHRIPRQMRVARGRRYLAVPEQAADHRQALAERQRPRRERMPAVVQAHVLQSGTVADPDPVPLQIAHAVVPLRARDDMGVVLEPGVGFDPVQLGRLDKQSDPAPGGSAFVVPREECIFPCEGNRPGEIFDTVAVHLDAAVGEEEPEAVPVAGDVAELLAEPGLGRDAGALLPEPFAEGLDQGRGARLSLGQTPFGRAAADIGLDGIELGDPAQTLGRDLRAALPLPAERGDLVDHWRRGRPAQSVRPRRAVLQAFASLGPEARDPFAHGAFTDPEGRGHGLRGLPLVENAAYDLGSTTRREFCILMDVHPGLPSRFVDRFRHPSASEIQPRMDNLLRDHT